MRTITCKVPEELAAKLDSLARAERCSRSALVREALEDSLKTKRPRDFVSGYDVVKHLCGSLKGGPPDLATNPAHMKAFGASSCCEGSPTADLRRGNRWRRLPR